MNNKVINHFLTLVGITIFSGCLFEEVDQPAELAIGDTFTTVLNINSIAQEVNNAHHGIVGVLHPEGWVFESGSFESTDAETPSGLMELDPDSGRKMICSEEQYNNNTCPSIDDFFERPNNMEWTYLISDVGDYYLEQTLFEVTLNFNTEEGAPGDFPIGYVTTVNTWGMLDWLNTEDNIDNPNMTDTSMNHMVTMVESSVNIDEKASIPGSFKLEQNYPNPFNPSTKIEFSLSSASEVSLEIFDINGNSVGNLVNNYMNAGTHHIVYDASNVSSGIYYYTLKALNKVQTKKMTLIK